jgi:thiosulfate/3-mercaptopyruvate sulfurtransferase
MIGKTMDEKILYTPNELSELMQGDNCIIIDIRDTEDYQEEHISGAVSVPDVFFYLSMTTPKGLNELHETFRKHFSEIGLSPEKTAIIYEDAYDSRYGGSCRGYWLLKYLGHNKVGILDGGYSAWVDEGYSVDSDPVEIKPTTFVVKPNAEILATKDEMIEALKNPNSVKLLDNRDKIEWIGKSSSPYGIDFAPRKGRIPGAIWIEWYEFLERDGKIPHFKTNDQIREMCAQKGFSPEDDIIIYCFKGARASNTFVALKEAGFNKIRNYFGSWNEWSRDEDLPIDDKILE